MECTEKNGTDLFNFIKSHDGCTVDAWGGYIGKNDGYTPFGYTIDFDKKTYFFGLDGHFIKTIVN